MADYNSDRTGSNIDAVLDKADNLTQAAVGVGGNVGIGTASPEDLLHVNKNGTGEVILAQFENGTNAGGTSASIKLRNHTDVCSTVLESHRNGADFGADFVIKTSNGVSGTIDERFRITEAGNVGIGTASPSGKLDVVGDINVSGGVYLGGTGAANKLDDYEEGTWNTALSIPNGSVSYSHVDLTYTKIGRVVYINGRLDILSVSSPSGILGLTLPFAVSSSSKRRYSNISVSTLNFDVPDNILSQAFTAESGSVANLLQTTDNGSWFNADASILTGNEEFQISGFYLTDS